MYNDEQYDNHTDFYDDAPDTGTALAVPTMQSIAVSQGSRAVRKMEQRVEMAAAGEQCKARLTQNVIVNTTALSAIADKAIAAVPSAREPVRGIVNVYAASSAAKIASTKWW